MLNWEIKLNCWGKSLLKLKFLLINLSNIHGEIILNKIRIKLEEKVIEVFAAMNIAITKNDVEDCHRLGKSSKSTIAWFMNRKSCYAILSKKSETSKIDKSKLGFEWNVKLYVSENLTPYNQHLACKCRELKTARVIHNSWSSKGIIKLRTANECPIPIDHEDWIAALYTDFVFNQRHNFKDRE